MTPWPGHAGVWLGTLKLTVEAGADPSWLEPLLREVRERSGARAEPREPSQPKAGDGR